MNSSTCLISRKIEFDMGHRVPFHDGKCKGLHGHRYVVEAVVRGSVKSTPGASDEGMVMDFGQLKTLMMSEIHDHLDHGLMLYEKDPLATLLSDYQDQKIIRVPFIPTAECIAKHVFDTLESAINSSSNLTLVQVIVRETPNTAAYYPGHPL